MSAAHRPTLFVTGAAAGIAKILFLVFLVLFVVSLLTGRRRSGL